MMPYRSRCHKLSGILLLLALFHSSVYGQGSYGQGNDFVDIALRAGHESNVPRGVDGAHELGSGFIASEVFAGRFYQLGLHNSLTVGVGLSARRYSELSGFDNIAAGLNAALSHKFGLGAYAPTLQLGLSYEQAYYRGMARDNERLAAELNYSQRLGPAWLLEIGLVGESTDNLDSLPMDPAVSAFGYDPDIALPYELYDYSAWRLYAGAEYTFENFVSLSMRYQRGNGYTIASTTEPSLKVYKVSRAFYSDPAFASDWFAYSVESNSHTVSAVLSLPLAADTGLDFTADWVQIAAPAGKDYRNELLSVALSWRF
ncbi:MAG: hypothetical protein MRY76_05250 [Pseudomonadales bacterium]|nr:hypothetical protein [Pseudomonadales bacterium]